MGKRGPDPTPAQELYSFAQLFYWDFRRLAEGTSRRRFDQKRYEAIRSSQGIQSKVSTQPIPNAPPADKPCRELDETEKDLEQIQLWAEEQTQHLNASEEAMITLKVPGELGVLKKLLEANTPERIRQICKDAFVRGRREVRAEDFRELRVANWPISNGSIFPYYLSLHAEQFLAAKRDPRFPRSNRPSNQLKQFWFLSRALAGALFNVSTRTALNLVGSLRPEQLFEESGAAKPVRTRKRSG